MAYTGPLDALKQQLESPQFLDLTIKCEDFVAKVHKAILCPQSEWFTKAVSEDRFLESKTNTIIFEEQTPEAVRAMIEFFYTADCEIPGNLDPGQEMLALLDVYALADFIQHEDLKDWATLRFSTRAMRNSKTEAFVQAAQNVYKIAPPGTHGHRLRTIVATIVSNNVEELFVEEDGPFLTMKANVPGLSYDVAIMLSGVREKEGQVKFLRDMMQPLKCWTCYRKFEVRASIGLVKVCPFGCGQNVYTFNEDGTATKLGP